MQMNQNQPKYQIYFQTSPRWKDKQVRFIVGRSLMLEMR